jgi:WD40 repeat protein
MRKRSSSAESSSSAAHKRHASTAPEEEGLLPAASSFLAVASSSSIPNIPLDLIADRILPFVADRATWNSVYCGSRELCRAAKKMTPPWPNKVFNLGDQVGQVAFPPSGSQLAFVIDAPPQGVIHVWDRWGKEALLEGHTGHISCLEYSPDGEYLASGGWDSSIRLWRAESFHAASSMTSRETPKQAAIILLGSGGDMVVRLSFSRTDSNLLASGGSSGTIKMWNLKEQVCIHSVNPGRGAIRSLHFAGGTDSACIAAAITGSVIRFWRAEDSSDFTSEIIGETAAPRAEFSPCGSFLATIRCSATTASTLAWYEIESMTETQSVTIPGLGASCVAFLPDSKQLVVGDYRGRIRLLQAENFNIQRDLGSIGGSENAIVESVAYDPTCRVLACCCDDKIFLRCL